MSFVPNTEAELKEMLQTIGVNSFEDLIKDIPQEARAGKLEINDPMSEMEALKLVNSLAKKNTSNSQFTSFLGGGIYDHYIPSIVGSVLERPEFKTAYTPYQAEVSQGTLQVMYEFQTMIARLADMEISNASLYDGGTSLAEAFLMANANNKKTKFLIAGTVNPLFLETTQTITAGRKLTYEVCAKPDGSADLDMLREKMTDEISAVIVQNPNFLGTIEDVFEIEKITHSKNALLVSVFNPISLGLIVPPGKYNADIALGEGQPLGIPVSFGGPVLGLFTCKEKLIRTLPGRIVGMSIDSDNNRAFTLTLQTREQQIKRERATSNICTNQGLIMLAATVYMETMGKQGLIDVATQSYQKAHYLASEIAKIPGFSLYNNLPFFNEFAITTPVDVCEVKEEAEANGFFAGINLIKFTDHKGLLIAVTEKRTKQELDDFVNILKKFAK
jgi:glycine dehydrogenase subunit 1